jgi:nitroreductase
MLRNLVLKNRSYRRFDASRPITAKTLIHLIELARNCPSAANLQSLRYLPVWDKQLLDAVFPHLRWAGYLRYWDGPLATERPTGYVIILCPLRPPIPSYSPGCGQTIFWDPRHAWEAA